MNLFVRIFLSFSLFVTPPLLAERHNGKEAHSLSIPARKEQSQIGRYTITKWLGEGDQGKVYKALDDKKNVVALKVFYTKAEMGKVHPERKKILAHYFEPDGTSKAAHEEYATAVLCSHPRIMKLLDKQQFVSDAGEKVTYLVLEYVEGKNLSKVAAKSLSKKRSLTLCRQLLDALSFSFSKGFIHDDLWGENIFLDNNKNLKLIDLGSYDPLPALAKGQKPKGTYRKYTNVIRPMLNEILNLGTLEKQDKQQLLAQADALIQSSEDCPMALESRKTISSNLDTLKKLFQSAAG